MPDYQTAFDEYLAKGAKAYIARKLYRPGEAVELMIEAGVVPVLAHPFTLNLPIEELERFVDELVGAGLRGIEGYHGDLPEIEQEPFALRRARGSCSAVGAITTATCVPTVACPAGRRGRSCRSRYWTS